jgi:hypothetical protein
VGASVKEKLDRAKRRIASAEVELDSVMTDVDSLPEGLKTSVVTVIEAAFKTLRTAEQDLALLETSLPGPPVSAPPSMAPFAAPTPAAVESKPPVAVIRPASVKKPDVGWWTRMMQDQGGLVLFFAICLVSIVAYRYSIQLRFHARGGLGIDSRGAGGAPCVSSQRRVFAMLPVARATLVSAAP